MIKAPSKKWSALIYIAGNNDLSPEAVKDLDEISAGGGTQDRHVCVQMDTLGRKGVLRYELSEPDFTGASHRQLIQRLPESNSGTVKTIRDFLIWGISRCTTKKRLVSIWGMAAVGRLHRIKPTTVGR